MNRLAPFIFVLLWSSSFIAARVGITRSVAFAVRGGAHGNCRRGAVGRHAGAAAAMARPGRALGASRGGRRADQQRAADDRALRHGAHRRGADRPGADAQSAADRTARVAAAGGAAATDAMARSGAGRDRCSADRRSGCGAQSRATGRPAADRRGGGGAVRRDAVFREILPRCANSGGHRRCNWSLPP